ncbi:MAG: cytochrome P450 [Pseudomonadales bacterium]
MLPPDDVLAPEAIHDPHHFFRRLREHDPVFWSERHKVWIVTGYHDVDRIFRDRSVSAAQMISAFRKKMTVTHADLLQHAMQLLDGWMLFNDPPSHTRLRDPVRRSFSPTVVNRLVPRIERHADSLLNQLTNDCDLLNDFAKPLTAMVICDLLGVDVSQRDFLHDWSRDFSKLIYGASSKDEDYLGSVARAGDRFHAEFSQQIEARRSEPGDDLLSKLIITSEDERWSESELIGACSMLLFAGHDTTSALLASGMRALLQHPDQAQLLQNDPTLLPTAVEELLRFDGPSKINIRVPVEPMQIGSHEIAAGQPLWLGILAANHDPAIFSQPQTLDIQRNPNPHIAFGAGIHFCLGPSLARAEAQVAFGRLLNRFPRLTLGEAQHDWSPTVVDRSLLALPVVLN